jgi:hypothetical protein
MQAEIRTISCGSGEFSTNRGVDHTDDRMERMITEFTKFLALKSWVFLSELGYFEGINENSFF